MSPALPMMSSAPPSVTWSPAARVVVVCRYGTAGNVGKLGHAAQTAGDVSVVAAVAMRPTIEAGRRTLGYSLATFRSDAGSFAVKRRPPQEICIHPRRGAVWGGFPVLSGNGGLRARTVRTSRSATSKSRSAPCCDAGGLPPQGTRVLRVPNRRRREARETQRRLINKQAPGPLTWGFKKSG
jgi:hypothetical protein